MPHLSAHLRAVFIRVGMFIFFNFSKYGLESPNLGGAPPPFLVFFEVGLSTGSSPVFPELDPPKKAPSDTEGDPSSTAASKTYRFKARDDKVWKWRAVMGLDHPDFLAVHQLGIRCLLTELIKSK